MSEPTIERADASVFAVNALLYRIATLAPTRSFTIAICLCCEVANQVMERAAQSGVPEKQCLLPPNVLCKGFLPNFASDFGFFDIDVRVITGAFMLFSILLIRRATSRSNRWDRIGVVCMIVGGAGNLCDRLRLGYVVDYFMIYKSMMNLNDILIYAGSVCLLASFLATWRNGKHDGRNA